jgi:hypothetical protein
MRMDSADYKSSKYAERGTHAPNDSVRSGRISWIFCSPVEVVSCHIMSECNGRRLRPCPTCAGVIGAGIFGVEVATALVACIKRPLFEFSL